TSLSPTHQDPRNAPSHRSFLDARGRTDLDPLIVAEGAAHSASKAEPQPPRYTICGYGLPTFTDPATIGWNAPIPDLPALAPERGVRPRTGPSSSLVLAKRFTPTKIHNPFGPASRAGPCDGGSVLRLCLSS